MAPQAKLFRLIFLECHYIYDPGKGDTKGRIPMIIRSKNFRISDAALFAAS
jgi:hypothetical protein